MSLTSLEPFDEAVYDAAREICAEGTILGGSHAFDDSAIFATAAGIRVRLQVERPYAAVSSPAITGALVRLKEHGLDPAMRLVEAAVNALPTLLDGIDALHDVAEMECGGKLWIADPDCGACSPCDAKAVLSRFDALTFEGVTA